MLQQYFGPLSKDACNLYLIFGMFGLIMMILTVITGFFFLVKNFKKLNFMMVANFLVLFFSYFLIYFSNRLLYTICMKTL